MYLNTCSLNFMHTLEPKKSPAFEAPSIIDVLGWIYADWAITSNGYIHRSLVAKLFTLVYCKASHQLGYSPSNFSTSPNGHNRPFIPTRVLLLHIS